MEYRSDLPWVRFLPAIAFFAFLYAGTTWVSAQGKRTRNALQDGDVVFQGNMGGQGAAIAQATRSPYTHCGIVFLENGVPMVWEAVGPVKRTPWKEFVHHGQGDHYVVKRPREAVTISEVAEMKKAGMAIMGRPYDIHFQMDDERIYCSELVYKMYTAVGRRIGALERFCDMDLEAPIAHEALVERFGGAVPCDAKVITPAALFRAAELVTVDSVGAPPRIP